MGNASAAATRGLGLGQTLGALFAGGIVLAIAFFAILNRPNRDPAEITRRCAESRPEWQNYQEDIKGQVGAAVVAEWHGAPTHLAVRGHEVKLSFKLEGTWAELPCGVPILLRDPLGHTVQDQSISAPGAERTYTFTLPSETVPPWLEVHYPHQERRLPLNAAGEWNASK